MTLNVKPAVSLNNGRQHYKQDTANWKVGLAGMLGAGICGSIAELVTLPVDTFKVRLQLAGEGSPAKQAHNFMRVYKDLVTTEGYRAFYGGASAAVQRQMVMASVKFGCYDPVKKCYCDLFHCDSNPRDTPKLVKLLAASTTGVAAVVCGQPTDVVKVRMQAQKRNAGETVRYSSSRAAYSQIYQREGFRGLWKGAVPGASRNMVVNASEIAMYDIIKTWIINNGYMRESKECFVVSAAITGVIATAIASPIDVVKTRYMNATSSQYSSIAQCVKHLWREKGLATFYKGVFPAGCRLVAWNIVMFLTFEQCKTVINSKLASREAAGFKFS